MHKNHRLHLLTLALAVAAALSACGGGSGSATPAGVTPPAPVTPAPTPAPTPAALITFNNASVHDPAVTKVGSSYYSFGSHLAAAKTTDLMN
ncbi:MAG: hypothetical protein Q7U12_10505, partial [Undibacterium sp.]|nr:hypothetical protein [Undibacterium sp.]